MGGFKLRPVSLQGSDPGLERGFVGRLEVVDLVGLEQQQRFRPMVLQAEVGQKMRISRCDDPIDRQPSGGPVIRVKAIALPGVMAQHHVGLHGADGADHLGEGVGVVVEFAIDAVEERDLARPSKGAMRLVARPGVSPPRPSGRRQRPRCPWTHRCR